MSSRARRLVRALSSRRTAGVTTLERGTLPSLITSDVSLHAFRPLNHILFQQHSRRTMVMVTKTSANDELPTSVPPPTTDESTAAAAVSQTSSDSDYSISITASCAQRIASLATKRSLSLDELYLRVFVDAGGCSGFQYQFELTQDKDEPVEEEDVVFVYPINNGDDDSQARVVVDQASLELIHGSTIDFVQEMIKSAFVVADNPQSESACGCGSSFAVKNFEANPALD